MRLKQQIFKLLSVFPWFEKLKYKNYSFAQEGEDLIVLELLNYKKDGFFVDVGAHHPFRFSNTYALKRHGWTGINIEPNPSLHDRFCKLRKDDINLNLGISESPNEKLTYYEFDEPALNTFSRETYHSRLNEGFKCITEKSVQVTTLENVFNSYAGNRQIDLLSVDVEGLDLEVLLTNNWTKFSPHCVLIEDHEFNFKQPTQIDEFLTSKKYKLAARTLRNSIYLKTTEA